MVLGGLRPGMEHVDATVRLLSLEEPREVLTSYGVTHVLVEGEVEDESGRMRLTIWNEKIQELEGIEVGSLVDLGDCFVTSFKGELSINVGRDSGIDLSD